MNYSCMSFSVINNVYIDVINKESGVIEKHVEKHNKATRQMVVGLLRFLSGHFTATSENDKPLYAQDAKRYIPCYFNVGDGGVILNDDGIPQHQEDNTKIPLLMDDWDYNVNYLATKLTREFNSEYRATAQKVENSFSIQTSSGPRTPSSISGDVPPAGDMDSLYFYCEIYPDSANSERKDYPVFITELGLFSDKVPGNSDLLAYVKLGNYYDSENNLQTDTLYVKPTDTIVVRWIISVAAIGTDGLLTTETVDENGDKIITTLRGAPSLGTFEIVDETAELT